MIVTVTGFPGTDTRRIGKGLALELGLKYFSEEDLRNRIAVEKKIPLNEVREELFPEKVKQVFLGEAKKKDVVFDHALAPWLLSEVDLKVFLQSSRKARAMKLSEKEKVSLKESLEAIEAKERKTAKGFLEGFGVNVKDLEGYDLILNVDRLKQESTIDVIKKYLEKME